MSTENEAYQEGQRLLRELTVLRNDVLNINASDTQCKQQALRLIERSRAELREALTVLAGLV